MVIAQTAALIKRNGYFVDNTGNANITIEDLNTSSFYICIKHFNHLGVMTAQPVDLTDSPFIDFSDPATQVYSIGGPAMRNLSGRMLMWAGDADGNGRIDAIDLNLRWRIQNGQIFNYGSSNADFNLNARSMHWT